jgi:excisionase family DNA binding protein
MKLTNKIFDNQIWLTSDEAASYLRLTSNAFRVMICKKDLGHIEHFLGTRKRYKRAELDQLIESSNSKRRTK